MHELSIAAGIVETVLAFAEARGIGNIAQVRLLVGELTCVEPEQLRFCFESIVHDSALEGAALEIETAHAVVRCTHCGYEGPPKYWEDAQAVAALPTLECPACSRAAEAIAGHDCAIKSIRYVRAANPAGEELSRMSAPTIAGHVEGMSQNVHRIEEIVAQIEQMPDAAARSLMRECLQALLGFYGSGLEQILAVVKQSGPGGEKAFEDLIHDNVVSGLLLIHGLHPLDLGTRLRAALDKVRPYMESHGGNVELLSLENEFAVLRLHGACEHCPSKSVTLELAVRQAMEEFCPDLAGFRVEGAGPAQTPGENGHAPRA